MSFDFSIKFTEARLRDFANMLINMQKELDYKVSSRGWCYLMEQAGYIDKSQFDKVDNAVNVCRRKGILPVDFVAEEAARAFSNLYSPSDNSISETIRWGLEELLDGYKYHTPDYREGEKYYIQVLVEKIDIKTQFEGVCAKYHIPIANAKGWSSILQRAEYAKRFKIAEEMGLQCVLLYCGDHDPDGLRISDTIRTNLEQVKNIRWEGGMNGYDPADLIIDRMGLNYDFIVANNYTWIDNLITGSGKNLASHLHRNNRLPYVRNYIDEFGVRKCEANAIVTTPKTARQLIKEKIESYLGEDAIDRFREKDKLIKDEYKRLMDDTGLTITINNFLNNY